MFSAPTLLEMRAVLRRALRDTGPTPVFSDELIDDFVVEALSDLSTFRPLEHATTAEFDPAITGGFDPADFAILTYIWQVEVRVNVVEALPLIIPANAPGEGGVRSGWDYYGGLLNLSQWWWNWLAENHRHHEEGIVLILYGYRDRLFPIDGTTILDLMDATDYLCVVRHARSLGFQALESDRSLYQQWLAATNNTDVSPTQLQGMRSQAEGSYERLRKQVSRPKRVPVTGIQYLS